MSGIPGDGGIRWNDETQRWEAAGESGAVVLPTPPPPPLPAYAPQGPVEPAGPGGPGGPGDDTTYMVTPPPAPLSRSRRTTALVAGVTVAVVAGGVAFGVVALRDDGPGDGTGTGAASVISPSPATTSDTAQGGGPTDTAVPTDTPSPTEVPSGYALQQDTAGFTVAVPEGWERQEESNSVFYNSPDGRSLVQIYTAGADSPPPYESLRQTSRTLRANKNYRELSLQNVPDGPGEQAAELVYAYDRTDGTRRKVVDRAFVAENGTQYAVLVAGPEGSWPQQKEILQVALAYFAP
ncbi:serine/arginine repetitive matrix protein 2 [Streptomyces cyaneus]|uniref:serine/arginine repetitive matrix protein 2 n=1 Tax=Streptomyces cyaneus TaxID=1904 RepID=UPI000FF8941F|nr:serine/arginine repetitive matrix protein 2 [Streptomyces cyaneus]